jgi:hypothetical protein
MRLSFRYLAIIASGICLALAVIWIFTPQFLLWIWHVDAAGSALLMARRGGALFLGIGAMLWRARDVGNSPARDAMATGFSICCAALAVLGIYEFASRHAGLSIWLAIVVEAVLGASFYLVRQQRD